jgi:putative ABC transport system permease protein
VVSARSIPLWSERYGGFRLVAVSGDISRGQRRFLWAAGSVAEVWSAVEKGAVIVSEPFAFHHHLPHAPGSRIELPTDDGPQQFAVAGIFYDYASDRGVVLMDDGIYRQHFRDRLISTVGLFVKPGQPVEALKTALQQQLGESRGLVWQSNRSLRQAALEIFDRTFAITAALRLLAAVVAFIGVLSTLMALQLERGRELGLLRATGMTVSQLWRMGLCETGLIGLCAGLLALPLGTLLALILIYVINLRSFGWTLGFAPLPVHYLQALAVSVTAALLAGIYPAYRSGQIPPAAAMRDE